MGLKSEEEENDDVQPDPPQSPPTLQRSALQRWGGLIASLILVWLLGCPLSTFLGLMYQQWTNRPGHNLYWDGVAVMLICWLVLGAAFSAFFIVRAMRAAGGRQ